MATSSTDAAQNTAATPSTDPDPAEAALVCGSCGRVASGPARAAALLSWGRGTERGRTTWTCEACSREHLRSIESKLDPAWW
jgi:hypothetical protein